MVQKGKVEETILESIPQLAIQLCNTWLLGQLQSMPPLTIFSISLSLTSLTNTMWYYAYWNLFRCMPIRDVPSTLALYNYKLSGVKDGAFSFAKTSSEVVEIELSEIDTLKTVVISPSVLNCDDGVDKPSVMPPRNVMVDALEPAGAGGLNAGQSGDSCDPAAGAAENRAEMSRLHRQNQEKRTARSKLRESMTHMATLQQEMQRMKAEADRLRIFLSILASASPRRPRDDRCSSHPPHVTRAAVTLQSVTRGHMGRLQFRALCRQVTQQLVDEALSHSSL